jgi:hypothetical protein
MRPGWIQGRVVVVGIALSACSPSTPPPPEVDQAVQPAAEAQITVLPRLSWDVRVTGVGVGLVLTTPVGHAVLRLSCVRDPDVMTLEVEPLEPVGSEERLTFGIDDEAFLFVADPTADRPSGVYAEAPIDDELLGRLTTGQTIGLSYGAQVLGPYRTPAPEFARTFVDACRRIAAG